MTSGEPSRRRVGPWASTALALVAIVFVLGFFGLGTLGALHVRADEPAPDDALAYLPISLRRAALDHRLPTVPPTQPAPIPTASPTESATASPTASPTASATASPQPAPPISECTDMDPDWVFCDDFEEGTTWDGSVADPPVLDHPGPFDGEANKVAQLRVPPGPGGHGLWKKLPESDRLYARWYIQWEPGHDLTAPHHGPGGLGADTAWYTGRSGIRPEGDEYFVSTLEPSTRSPHFVYAYTYYRGMDMDCADPNGRCWGDHFPCYASPRYCTRPEYLPKVEQPGTVPGRWYCVEQMIDAGTPVTDGAEADGQLDFWIDGLQIGPWTDLWWRTVADLKINFLWLYLYHHDDTHSVEGILLDNVVVSTSRVGCPK